MKKIVLESATVATTVNITEEAERKKEHVDKGVDSKKKFQKVQAFF